MTTTEWPTREQWAKSHRTCYDFDDVHVSAELAAYATPAEIAAAIAEAKAHWAQLGRDLKTIGHQITDAEWSRRFLACPSREERMRMCELPERKHMNLRHQRSRLNREIIKTMERGIVPDVGFRVTSGGGIVLCCGHDYTDTLPLAAEICRRHWAAYEAARDAKVAEYANRPVDDAAWQAELDRRESVRRWLNGDRFHGHP